MRIRVVASLLVLWALVGAAGAQEAGARQSQKPTVRSAHASGIDDWSAVLRGNINPHGLETSWRFQLGTTRAYGLPLSGASLEKSLGGTRRVAVEEAVNCLAPMTTYHFRIVARNRAGKTYGPDQTFTTKRQLGSEPGVYERCPGHKPLS